MKVVILAGGLGTRLTEETITKPKPLVEVGGMPILWHIMKLYSQHGINEFIICLGYKGYLVKDFFTQYRLHRSDLSFDLVSGKIECRHNEIEPWRVHLVDTGDESMTGGRLLRVRDYLDTDEPFCMTYGDGLSDVNISAEIQFHRHHGRKATLLAVQPPGRFGAFELHANEDRVAAFREKPDGDGAWVSGGFFVLNPEVLDYISGDDAVWEREPMERLAQEGELVAYRHRGFWQPMDTLRDRHYLESLWAANRAPWHSWSDGPEPRDRRSGGSRG
jgi:glucose-1-phosphate cytidylyltransferase